ncbi:hypothetical protein AB3N02_22000 [Priestia aryabhattai]|uniref:hypothetical protein n=1 Tax=Priestia aryabhattai TaxID=412384 RepID=UPI0039A2A29F
MKNILITIFALLIAYFFAIGGFPFLSVVIAMIGGWVGGSKSAKKKYKKHR